MGQGTAEIIKRRLLVAAGVICVALGVIGMAVPVLPTTPFLLLAAICFVRSSPRFYNWLITNRWFGAYIRNYREGRGIPLRQKVITLVILWLAVIYAAVIAPSWWMIALLGTIATGVTLHIVRVKTMKTDTV